jgi:hypothetical protein
LPDGYFVLFQSPMTFLHTSSFSRVGLLLVSFFGLLNASADEELVLSKGVEEFLDHYCLSCHEEGTEKGKIRLDHLPSLTLKARLELLNKVQEQVYLGEMPPKKKDQPEDSEREDLLAWVSSELEKYDASTLEEKMSYHGYGNYVDHDKLFSGEFGEKAFTPSRRWMVRPAIFEERVKDVFKLEARERAQTLYGVTNPFVLPERAGIRDYANTTLDGGHLLVMLTNAKWIAEKQTFAARHQGVDRGKIEFPNPKDKWYPAKTPETFEVVILKEGPPSDEELLAAIQTQFDCVLQRRANNEEEVRYLELTRNAIELGGNVAGLQQMLMTVLLESEFLYRLEFGDGEFDEFGRQKLSPREAGFAIAYALGDRGPDAGLVEAAQAGRLQTKEDFEREVRRLLADEQYYRGAIDPSLNGKHTKSHETSHPRLVHFFRDFFGYRSAIRIFKDTTRSGGFYSNPCRGSTQTPGFLVIEADRILDWHLQTNENVFEKLLTGDQFFVYHDKDNEAGQKVIETWREAWEQLKDTNWKTEPEKVIAGHPRFFDGNRSFPIRGNQSVSDFFCFMYFFEETFGRGRTPFTTIPWAHGYAYHHSPFYNLPRTPSIGRYYQASKKGFQGFDEREFWDYPVEQPFQIQNRKGLLTHPAWLIAHSLNTTTDPVKRGRWIREKLLAGRVPDIPITVDAQVPEDHHFTFRERLEGVTTKEECWKCHRQMNPLGLPFEIFDDFGRFRTEESREHPDNLIAVATEHNGANTYKTSPIDSSGALTGSGDPKLDGEVGDALELIDRLAKSDRVRQSIIRHAFRFFMGRNEFLSDSQTLIDADKAYVDSGGSFKEVVVSLLSSDSFIYRKPTPLNQ